MLSLKRIFPLLGKQFPKNIILRGYNNRSLTGSNAFSPFSLFGTRSSDLNDLFREFDRLSENMWHLNSKLNLFDRGTNKNNQVGERKDNIQAIDENYDNTGDINIGDKPRLSEVSSRSSGPSSLDFLKNLDLMQETPIKLDLEEEADKYIVKVTIPDFTKDQVRLRVSNGALSITAEQKLEKKDDNSYIDSVKRVTQAIRLPQNVKTTDITARHEGNVLFITIPKKDIIEKEHKGQNIQIQ